MASTQEIFEAFLITEPDPASAVEQLCARHPERESELRKLWDGYRRMARFLDRIGSETREDGDAAPDGRLEVRREIARGGMGRVLEVWDKELRRTLAMKVLHHESDGDGATLVHWTRRCSRLLNEAQILGQLEHPSIVPVHEVGRDTRGRPYFTMLRVRGRALGEVFDDVHAGRGGWSLARAVGALHRACEAVAHAHEKGVIHRDLKPSNVMVGRFGEVFVMDWGLAKARGGQGAEADLRLRTTALTAAADSASAAPASPSASVRTDRREAVESEDVSPLLTMDGDVLGTPSYMAPEQAAGRIEDVDERSDVYSAGAMLYHLLAGRAPYVREGKAPSPKEVLRAVMEGAPDPLHGIAPTAPRELAAVCAKAMARERGERYGTMAALADDLRAYLEGRVVQAYGSGQLIALRKWMQRHRIVAALLVLLLTVLAGSTVGFALLYRLASDQRDVAERRLAFLEQNPSGFRVDLSLIPSLPPLEEDFDDGELDLPLRVFSEPESVEWSEGRLVLRRRGPAGSIAHFGLNDSLAVIRGDFDVSITLESDDLSPQPVGGRVAGLCVRRAHDGLQVAMIQRQKGPTVPMGGYVASTVRAGELHVEPWDRPKGGFRIVREGRRVTAQGWCGEWRSLLSEEVSDEPVTFSVYVTTYGGDDGEVRVAFDDLRVLVDGGSNEAPVGPIVETFDDGLGPYLLPIGEAGVAATVGGHLEVANLPGLLGQSAVGLDSARYVLSGDFDVSLRFEILDSTGPPGALELRLAIPSVGSVSCEIGELLAIRGLLGADQEVARSQPTRETSGRLRARRTGSRVSFEYWDDGWRELLTTTESREKLSFCLGLYDQGTPASGVVAIDDLRIEGVVARR